MKASYQSLKARLDEVLSKLESPDLDVDEAADIYEQAVKLIKQLEAHLKQTKNRIKQVSKS